MAKIKFKAEPISSSTSTARAPAPNPPKSITSIRAAAVSLNQRATASAQDPKWKICAGDSPFRQLQIKEQAVKNGLEFLTQVKGKLQLHGGEDPACKRRIHTIEAIIARKKEYRLFIGFLGTTGAGKTSVINALLGFDLLPVDNEKACTAVPVEVSWNPDDDENSLFKAEFERISHNDWRAELEGLYKDLEEHAQDDDGEDGEEDEERQKRINATFQKVRSVYPYLKTKADYLATAVDTLMSHENVRSILGQALSIKCGDRDRFVHRIAPYINSNKSKVKGGKAFAHWPLVKLAKLQIKAPILKDRIILVDLPGNMDSNAARNTVAEKYHRALTVTCVVAPAERASSDKPAQDLLGKVTQRNMQMDGFYNGSHLCFVVSKSDNNIDMDGYIKRHPKLEKELASTISKEKGVQQQIREIASEQAKLEKDRKKTEIELKILDREVNKLSKAQMPKPLRGHKRKYGKDDDDQHGIPNNTADQQLSRDEFKAKQIELYELQQTALTSADKLLSLTRRYNHLHNDALWFLKNTKMAASVESRNSIISAAIKEDYERVVAELGKSVVFKPLQVFCVSAFNYLEYIKENSGSRYQGFPTKASTKIPTLRDWLISTSFESREQRAQAFLEELEGYELVLKRWASDSTVDMKLDSVQRSRAEIVFNSKLNELDEKIAKLNLKTSIAAENLAKSEITEKLPEFEKIAAAEAVKLVKQRDKIHWATHRAINRSTGRFKSKKSTGDVEYHWNDDLALKYTDPLLMPWNDTFNGQLPTLKDPYVTQLLECIAEFADIIMSAATKVCPGMSESLDAFQESVLKTRPSLKQDAFSAWVNAQDEARTVHRLVLPQIFDKWIPVYEKCAAEKGTGHFQRNKDTHRAQLQKNVPAMYRASSDQITSAITKLFENFHESLGNGYQQFKVQISGEFTTILEQNSTASFRKTSNRKVNSSFKKKINEALAPDFGWLVNAWSRAPDAAIPENDVAKSYGCNVEELLATVCDTEEKLEKDDDWVSGNDSGDDEY